MRRSNKRGNAVLFPVWISGSFIETLLIRTNLQLSSEFHFWIFRSNLVVLNKSCVGILSCSKQLYKSTAGLCSPRKIVWYVRLVTKNKKNFSPFPVFSLLFLCHCKKELKLTNYKENSNTTRKVREIEGLHTKNITEQNEVTSDGEVNTTTHSPGGKPKQTCKIWWRRRKRKLCQYAIVVVVEIQNRRNDKHKLDEI